MTTISQYFKNTKDLPIIQLKETKTAIKNMLLASNQQFFTAMPGKRLLDPLTNYFTYTVFSPKTLQSIVSSLGSDKIVGWARRNFELQWANVKDYIIANANNGPAMAKFNTTEYTYQQLENDVDEWHARLEVTKSEPGAEGNPIVTLDHVGMPGWAWVSLDKSYCSQEARAAGHCGNQAGYDGDNIISLRDENNHVHLTFIVNNKLLGESKGRNNSKPSPKYHKAIIELLTSPYIDSIQGGGYKPENNFQLTDLSKPDLIALKTKKPYIDYIDWIFREPVTLESLRDYFDYEKKKNFQILEYKDNNVILNKFEGLSDLEQEIHPDHNFAWIDEMRDSYEPHFDISHAISSMPNHVRDAIENYLKKEMEEDEEFDFKDAIENNDSIELNIQQAYYDGQIMGAESEAYKDLEHQFRSTSNGFFVDFRNGEVGITLPSLKELVKDNINKIQDGDYISTFYDFKYNAPYNGYFDFSNEAYVERLMDELPREIVDEIKKNTPKKKKR